MNEVYTQTLKNQFSRNAHSKEMDQAAISAFKMARRDKLLGTRLLTSDKVDRIVRAQDDVAVFVSHTAQKAKAIYHFSPEQFSTWIDWLEDQGLQITVS